MSLEAALLCIDNSEWMRNGDYVPSRFEAQEEAVRIIAQTRTDANQENSVGMLTMAGKSPELLVALGQDPMKIFHALPKVKIEADSHLLDSLKVAQLCLRHRNNKRQRQRIISFVGSPISADKKDLATLGRQLKKNNIALDIISFGEVFENQDKLEALYQAVNNNDNSHLIEVPYGEVIIADWLMGYSFLFGSDFGEGSSSSGSSANPDEARMSMMEQQDPELAFAIRMSLEEAKQKEAAGKAEGGDGSASGSGSAPASSAPAPSSAPAAFDDAIFMDDDDMDEEMREAIALSMAAANASANSNPSDASASGSAPADNSSAPASSSEPAAPEPNAAAQLVQDQSFLDSVLESMDGDLDDPELKAQLEELKKKFSGEDGGNK
eukprot:TRINITY_DN630_c0_g2_i1.p2 TRINITY_DN630_c0_g2~~TRINITY_DN630_c0_g2_i1.p2  ORF type:complete len:381 (-),score=212.46 TRINITY_DN630_c0_g2_i1:226-1368(-)